MVVATEENVDTQRTRASEACELMYKLPHSLGKHSRRHFLAEVVLKLYCVLSRSVHRIATIRSVASSNLQE